MKNALTLIIAISLISCNRHAVPRHGPVKSTEVIRERLVPVSVPGDSSLLSALFACDSLNNVYLKAITEQKGRSIESSVLFENGQFNYKTKTPPDTIYIPATDTIYKTEVPITVEVPVETNKLLWWQKWLMYFGGGFLLLAAGKVYNRLKI